MRIDGNVVIMRFKAKAEGENRCFICYPFTLGNQRVADRQGRAIVCPNGEVYRMDTLVNFRVDAVPLTGRIIDCWPTRSEAGGVGVKIESGGVAYTTTALGMRRA